MKVKINRKGLLQLTRKGVYQTMRCPYSGLYCGDSCPMFEEPRDSIFGSIDSIELIICNNKSFYISKKDFIDERVEEVK